MVEVQEVKEFDNHHLGILWNIVKDQVVPAEMLALKERLVLEEKLVLDEQVLITVVIVPEVTN